MFRSRILILVNCPISRTKMAAIWKIRFVVAADKACTLYVHRPSQNLTNQFGDSKA